MSSINVPVQGTGTHGDPRRPALPAGSPFVVTTDDGDTMAVQSESLLSQKIDEALATLQSLIDYPPVAQVPTGTLTTAQVSTILRALGNEANATRLGAQQVARTLRDTIRLVRGDFGELG